MTVFLRNKALQCSQVFAQYPYLSLWPLPGARRPRGPDHPEEKEWPPPLPVSHSWLTRVFLSSCNKVLHVSQNTQMLGSVHVRVHSAFCTIQPAFAIYQNCTRMCGSFILTSAQLPVGGTIHIQVASCFPSDRQHLCKRVLRHVILSRDGTLSRLPSHVCRVSRGWGRPSLGLCHRSAPGPRVCYSRCPTPCFQFHSLD